MPQVLLEVGDVFFHQIRVTLDHQQVLRVLLLRRLREVERSCDQCGTIDDYDLVVSDGVLGIDVGGDTGVGDERGRRLALAELAPVQDHRQVSFLSFSRLLFSSKKTRRSPVASSNLIHCS